MQSQQQQHHTIHQHSNLTTPPYSFLPPPPNRTANEPLTNAIIPPSLIRPSQQKITNPFENTIDKRILTAPEYLEPEQIQKSYSSDYIKEYEYIAGSENLFPILLQIIDQSIYICSKDCFITFPIQSPSDYQKIKLPEMPTSFLPFGPELLLFGLRSGLIIVYNILTKQTLATCEEFSFPVIQMAVVDGERVLGIDLCGNLKVLGIGGRLVGERVGKVAVSGMEVVEQFRVKKRDKLKNFVKNLPFRSKDKPQPSTQPPQNDPTVYSQNEQIPKFCILPANLRTSAHIPIIYYYRGTLKCLILDQKNTKISETTILQKIEGKIGMMELGQGGFSNSNQAHIILVLTIQNSIHFYRQLQVESTPQYIKISTISHTCPIHTGKFLSNNLLIFLTHQGIELANINQVPILVHKLAYEKFSYIDFFNQEEGFNFDKRLLYGNIMRIGGYGDGDCMWVCLEGKRVVLGRVGCWSNYLNVMADNYLWEKCLKSALMIYKDKITLLGGIPERIESRNEAMQNLFQKITLTYLSYSLKNSQNPLQNNIIVHNVIDFMIRTECYGYLFTTLYEAVKGYGLEEMFLEELEEYIESGSVRWMSDEVLMKVVKHYTTIPEPIPNPILQPESQKVQQPQNQPSSPLKSSLPPSLTYARQHLQTLITSFDLTKMQRSLLLFICLNNELYRSLIYICIEQGDYVTPVIKLCGLRIAKGQELRKLVMDSQKIGQNREKIKYLQSQLQKVSVITFFYLHESLLGHNTQHNNPRSYLLMLQQLISFIFIPSSLLMLLQASCEHTFGIVGMLCGVDLMQEVLENGGELEVKRCGGIREARGLGFEEEFGVCGSRYFSHQASHVDQNNSNCESFPIFSQTSSEQFRIYNNMLSILVHTILTNYSKHHPDHKNLIPISKQLQQQIQQQIEPQIQPQIEPQIEPQIQPQIEPTNQEQLQSQEFLHQLHTFITRLILSNTFPVRLGWRILVFQFGVAYPHILGAMDGRYQEKDDTDQLKVLNVNGMLMRIVDLIVWEVGRMGYEGEILEANLAKVLNFILEPVSSKKIIEHYQLLIPTKCYILDQLDRPKQIIQTLIASENESIRLSLFPYLTTKINSILQSIIPPSSLAPSAIKPNPKATPLAHPVLSYLLSEKLPTFLSLSQSKSLTLLTTITHKLMSHNLVSIEELLKISESLRAFPEIQLGFIQGVIREYEGILHLRSGEYQYGSLGAIGKNLEMLAVRHLKVVVQFCPQKLQENVLKINYPLEQAFRVCQQCNNKTAMAYVLIKSGRNMEGVLLICDLFSTNCREVLRSLAKNVESEGTATQMAKMEGQLEKILETCCQEYVNDVQRGEEMFEKVIEKLFKQLNPKVIDNIPIPKIRELLQSYITKIIHTTFSLVNPQFFIEKFSKNSKLISIPTRLYVQAYNLVCGRLGFKYEINFIAKEMLRESEMRMYRGIVRDNGRGIVVDREDLCQECQAGLWKGEGKQEMGMDEMGEKDLPVLTYNCGHKYHLKCYNNINPFVLESEGSKEKSPGKSPSTPTKKSKKIINNFCPNCKEKWQNIISEELKIDAERFSARRERRKSILVERKNKLIEFDSYDWFGVRGQVFGKDGQRVY